MEVFFLVFSNDSQQPLPNLKDEAQEVYKYAMRKAMDKNFMPFYDPFASVRRINELMDDCSGLISVFLYSGHALNNEVLLDGAVGCLDGIALKLKPSVESGKLKLVILNACATREAVQAFLDIGAPVVIATQAKIDDLGACEFAKSCFRKLCNDGTILEAYRAGLAAAQTANTGLKVSNRGIRKPADLAETAAAGPLWEMFTRDDRLTALTVVPEQKTTEMFRSSPRLLKTIYTNFYNGGNEKVMDLWRKEKEKNVESDQSDIETAITNSIPRPIGFQLEKLLREDINSDDGDDYNNDLLLQLTEVFQCANEFFAIIMISQLWEAVLYAKRKGIRLNIPEDVNHHIHAYFELQGRERDVFNYADMVLSIRNYMRDADESTGEMVKFLVRQDVLKDFLGVEEEEYRRISSLLARRRADIFDNRQADNFNSVYTECETALCSLMNLFSFIHRYKLNSVRVIEAVKNRYEPAARFSHKLHILNQVVHDRKDNIINFKHLDSHCIAIILKADNDSVLDYLILSPFIIDETVFDIVANRSVLKVFCGTADGRYFYRDMKKPSGPDAGNEIRSPELVRKITEEFNSFKADVMSPVAIPQTT